MNLRSGFRINMANTRKLTCSMFITKQGATVSDHITGTTIVNTKVYKLIQIKLLKLRRNHVHRLV